MRSGRVPGRKQARKLVALSLLTLLASCVNVIPRQAGPELPPAPTAVALGVRPGPSLADLSLTEKDATAALAAFRESCPRVMSRTDGSGLTRPDDWRQACTAAANWGAGSAVLFFVSYFEAVQVGDGKAHATGYYEPEIVGSSRRMPGFDVPVYGVPSDLVRARAGDAQPLASGKMPLGRYGGDGTFVPYYDRAAIEQGALMGRGREIAWAADPVEFFFLQVQGSGRLRAPDGSVMRIGYAGQNGLAYTGIGAVMRERGLIGDGPGQYPGSMQGIMQYIREHPAEGRALMDENKSYVFFKALVGDGPLGALNVPVRPRSSVAADPRYVPLGAPVWLDLDRGEADGLWIAQDTGGAIKGANRFDTFWGAGDQARTIAGGMSARGQALVLVPRGTLARLGVG
ncbi:murein transglycosylase A [Novosphingobium mangrovi (ex Huang et al. 2023)]|uniref:peptidoglycan lytic exotransglycosylase n=1 Tax=Novosphingobium mangrovi (ex Huang et al. 2023) TaxID=2976432 RepID=A0ABT2I2P6_9SPHN|nr:murein transglycosylase A [Novosphingobium mangrovi (ex Huang et al. 2023)]MCT2399070.1 murein transglycosylase A [Novosphingobium mangrovi (ex Huang et al. 2023)]